MARFDRDVLTPTDVRWLILLEGVNDLGTASPVAQPADAGYQHMAAAIDLALFKK